MVGTVKKAAAILAVMAVSIILAAGCQGNTSAQDTDGLAEGIVDEIKTHAAAEIKKAVSGELEEFFENGDLAASLGISGEAQERLKNNIKNYIKSYSADEEQLARAKKELEALLENAQGLSAEGIEEKISEIFSSIR